MIPCVAPDDAEQEPAVQQDSQEALRDEQQGQLPRAPDVARPAPRARLGRADRDRGIAAESLPGAPEADHRRLLRPRRPPIPAGSLGRRCCARCRDAPDAIDSSGEAANTSAPTVTRRTIAPRIFSRPRKASLSATTRRDRAMPIHIPRLSEKTTGTTATSEQAPQGRALALGPQDTPADDQPDEQEREVVAPGVRERERRRRSRRRVSQDRLVLGKLHQTTSLVAQRARQHVRRRGREAELGQEQRHHREGDRRHAQSADPLDHRRRGSSASLMLPTKSSITVTAR